MFKYVVGLLLVAASAHAQPPVIRGSIEVVCSTTDEVNKQITNYGEHMLWSAVESSTVVVSLWQNLDTKTFTVTKTDVVRGITCIISMGHPPPVS
jgi:hypothetical protein